MRKIKDMTDAEWIKTQDTCKCDETDFKYLKKFESFACYNCSKPKAIEEDEEIETENLKSKIDWRS